MTEIDRDQGDRNVMALKRLCEAILEEYEWWQVFKQYVMRERQREVVEKMLTERTKMRDDSRWFLTDAAAERYQHEKKGEQNS